MEKQRNDTITVTIPQAMRGLLTAFIIAGGGGVSYLFASGGVPFKAECDHCKELALEINILKSRVSEIESETKENTRARWGVLNTRWSFKDQQVWADDLQSRNKGLNVPNPRNGHK